MIEINHLTKIYGSHLAVSDLSATVEPGQIYGFLGPNGAGKSTTMNIMTGCLSATDGTVKIGGYDIYEQSVEAKRLIGYLPEQPPLYLDMTPTEYLTFVAKAKGVGRSELPRQLEHVIDVTGIGDVKNRLIKNLSKGYRQRVGIAQALLADPKVIILDEPTVGLDPLQIIEIRELISKLGKEHTVILSSHILSEVRAVCDHIMIISKGKLVASDTPENLEKLFAGTMSLDLTVKAPEDEARSILKNIGGIAQINPVRAELQNASAFSIELTGHDDISEAVFYAFSAAQKPILRMGLSKASLEDVFLELTAAPAEPPENKSADKPPEERSDDAQACQEAADAEQPAAPSADTQDQIKEDKSNAGDN